jgi:hypothetical protein
MPKLPRKVKARSGTSKSSSKPGALVRAASEAAVEVNASALATDLGRMIEAALEQVAQAINVGLTMLQSVGRRIRIRILGVGEPVILCAGKKRETVEYLDLGARSIHMAAYITELPPSRRLAGASPSRHRVGARSPRPRGLTG